MIEPYADDDVAEPFTTSALFNGVRLSTRVMPPAEGARSSHWCEAFPVSPDLIALSIGDVRGYGNQKFEAMVAIRRMVRFAVRGGLDPAQTLTQANRFIHGHAPHVGVTAIVGLLDTRRRSLTYANAGHPPPLMRGPFGTLFLQSPRPDPPLGVAADARAVTHRVSAPAATLFVFYTCLEAEAVLSVWTPCKPMLRRRKASRLGMPACARAAQQWRRGSPETAAL